MSDNGYHDNNFKEDEIVSCLSVIDGTKTFGDLDVKDVFHLETPNKGTLGNLMEMSIFGMKKNSLQKADLNITYANGIMHPTELKTTGVHDRELADGEKYHAKEPTSLTAVSIGTIENETWEESHFYNKLAHLLWVFYFYKRNPGQETVPYDEYNRFPVLGYKFTHIADDKKEIAKFKNDWEQAKNFLIEANKQENPEALYPLLHQSIKSKLFYVDIAPRYVKADSANKVKSQSPRFRIKKSYVNSVFQQFWQERSHRESHLELLPKDYASFEELEKELHELAKKFKGKTVEELVHMFDIHIPNNDLLKIGKSISEQIVVRMLGGKSKKISNIELFNKIGIIPKTITVTRSESRTEDTKLFTMDLEEMKNPDLDYYETFYYQYFNDYQFLCIIFEEPSQDAPLKDNVFVGFKRLLLSDDLIEGEIKSVYDIACNLIRTDSVRQTFIYDKFGKQRFTKNTKVPMTALNFPKSEDYNIFVRGTGADATDKRWTFVGYMPNGDKGEIKSYPLQFWIKGKYITDLLKEIEYI